MSSYLQVKKLMGQEKTQDLLKDCTPTSCKGKFQKMKDLLRKQGILSEDQKKELAQKKDNLPVEAPQASTSNNLPQKDKKTPKNNQKGKKNAKGKAKSKWNKPYPQNYRIQKKEKTAMDNVFNMARALMELKTRRGKY
ncbi:hypothetical protein O181_042835 [Austropuccinia psidii MF-1]|uniref:Uncharacterized protein n=1 Tax=Austropuccinia psidii MF-1 TaxID=1389203 RepID=A0A9Q3DLD5_9BASI|nr:hypothetical protein [Austropuccinia psidii MF-1]